MFTIETLGSVTMALLVAVWSFRNWSNTDEKVSLGLAIAWSFIAVFTATATVFSTVFSNYLYAGFFALATVASGRVALHFNRMDTTRKAD